MCDRVIEENTMSFYYSFCYMIKHFLEKLELCFACQSYIYVPAYGQSLHVIYVTFITYTGRYLVFFFYNVSVHLSLTLHLLLLL